MEAHLEAMPPSEQHEIGASMQMFCAAHQLSPREREVLVLVCRGYHPKMVAEMIGAGYESVRTHLRRIYKKVGCSGVRELVVRVFAKD